MKINIKVIFLASLFFTSSGLFSQNVPTDSSRIVKLIYPSLTKRDGVGIDFPKPPPEHPRLLFRAKDIPALKAKISHPLMKECWDKIIKSAGYQTDGFLKPSGSDNNPDAAIRNSIEARALLYAFNKDKKLGREAINILLNYYSTLTLNYKTLTDLIQQYHANVDIGRNILMGAMVYDWCYDLLTAGEMQILISNMESMATRMEIEWPRLRQGSVVGHGSEAQLARDMLAAGIAVYDEHPVIYNLAAGRIFAEFVPARKDFIYPAGFHHQGSSYGPQRFNNEMWTTFIFDRMGYPSVYGPEQARVPYFWVYLRRPDGQYFRDGDDSREQRIAFGTYWSNAGDMLAGSYFNDPLLLGEAKKEGQLGREYLFDYLFYNVNAGESFDKSGLPLTKYFREPAGMMIARTGWDEGINSNSVVAFMKIGVQSFANHQHLDAGSFQLYYKGPLAIESGIYQGKAGGYGSEHFKNYLQRSIAHNTMLIYKPDEKFLLGKNEVLNDGGQQFQNRGSEPANMDILLQNDYKTGEVLAHYYGPDKLRPEVSYLKGELAESYSDKIKSFARSFVFLNLDDTNNPAALIVFDRVVANDMNYKKLWLLHTVEQPVINGNVVTVCRKEKGYNGQLINTTIYPSPENSLINKVGGKGNEFNVFGKVFPDSVQNPLSNSADSPTWRIELSPKSPEETDIFLNVMQVMNCNDSESKIPVVERISSGEFVGVKLNDRIVLFNQNGDEKNVSFEINLKGKEEMKIMIADVAPGKWKIVKPGGKKEIILTVDAEQKLLYFAGEKGKYRIEKIN